MKDVYGEGKVRLQGEMLGTTKSIGSEEEEGELAKVAKHQKRKIVRLKRVEIEKNGVSGSEEKCNFGTDHKKRRYPKCYISLHRGKEPKE